MERLDIVDEWGNLLGYSEDREIVHTKGLFHRTSHVWLLRKNNESIEILVQKRSMNKDSFPGCYDISSAGHIPSGEGFEESAIRELNEELHVVRHQDDLIYIGSRTLNYQGSFHGKPFVDKEFSHVYIVWCDLEEDQFLLQKEEIERVKWFDFFDLYDRVKNNTINHCIYLRELEMIKRKLW